MTQENLSLSIKQTRLEKGFRTLISPFETFIHRETTSGILLMACTIIALCIVNFGAAQEYAHFLHTQVSIGFGEWRLEKTLHHWINDGLMTLFFFVVGLEIKREFLVGELADMRQASLPIIAALGGMVVPALIYASLNHNGSGSAGWGIPMATDIAFAVGALVLLGSRVPKALFTFLVALAIVDDLGAVLVIAIFYTETLHYDALAWAGLFLTLLVLTNLFGIRRTTPYAILGGLLWFALLKSGIHATLAGVLTALTIPSRTRYEPETFVEHARSVIQQFADSHQPGLNIMQNETQQAALQTLTHDINAVSTPLQRLEHALHLPVAFLIIPIFALANAGVPLQLTGMSETLSHPVTLGVMLGLVLGKCIGIFGFSWLAIKVGIGKLPTDTSYTQLAGAAMLAGIGFTMSIFVAELAFTGQQELLLMAKTGILFASLVAGIVGYIWLFLAHKNSPQ